LQIFLSFLQAEAASSTKHLFVRCDTHPELADEICVAWPSFRMPFWDNFFEYFSTSFSVKKGGVKCG
jgi:hypothetical protein